MTTHYNLSQNSPSHGKKVHLKRIRGKFCIFAIGVSLAFGTHTAMLNLQSSLNIEDGLGTTTGFIIQISGVVCALLFSSIIVRVFRPKYALIISEATFALFIIANIWKKNYTLFPAGVLDGAGSSVMWPCVSLYNVHYGMSHSSVSSKENVIYIQLYTGLFFGVFQFNQIFGNLVSTIILSIGNSISNNGSTGVPPTPNALSIVESQNVTMLYISSSPCTTRNTTAASPSAVDYSICGSRDCQDPNITGANIDRYTTNQTALYIMIGVLVFFDCLAILMHFIILPDIDSKIKDIRFYRNNFTEVKTISSSQSVQIQGYSNATFKTGDNGLSMNPLPSSSKDLTSNSVVENGLNGNNHHQELSDGEVSATRSIYITLRDTFYHMVSPMQLLMIGITWYDGLLIGFASSELTRAYASCVLGVSQAGIGMIVYGVGDALFSFVVTKLPMKGLLMRNLPILISFVIDIVNYTVCLIWIPNLGSGWIIYLFFFGLGATDGIWQTLLNIRYAEYFPDRHDIAFTAWNMWIMIGIACQFGWSTSLCVSEKLYIQYAVLCVTMCLYGIAEYKYHKSPTAASK